MVARLTTADAARRRGVNPSRIRQLILDGTLPAEKQGRDWLIEEKDLDALPPAKRGRPRKTDV